MKAEMRTELEAAAFRRLVQHLRERSDVLPRLRVFHSARKRRERSSTVCLTKVGGRRFTKVLKGQLRLNRAALIRTSSNRVAARPVLQADSQT
jgi:hypothetical protein